MEAGQVVDGYIWYENRASYGLAGLALPPARLEHSASVGHQAGPAVYHNKNAVAVVPDQRKSDSPASVFHCYVFKSRLQEYCQKAGLKTPVYETIKQGPSHEPIFRSTVTLGDTTYHSLPGFFNRKAAEQSAAEVALVELAKSGLLQGKSQPVQETGLCKNLLQEYAQKMNFAAPVYECHRDEKQGRPPMHHCVVEIGGTKYIGTSAMTKKEAEIKAARTALLAIQSASLISQDQLNSMYTVIPQKKRAAHQGLSTQETASPLKPKKRPFKKYQHRKRLARKRVSSNDLVPLEAGASIQSGTTPGFDAAGGTKTFTDTPVGREADSIYDMQDKMHSASLSQETSHGDQGPAETAIRNLKLIA